MVLTEVLRSSILSVLLDKLKLETERQISLRIKNVQSALSCPTPFWQSLFFSKFRNLARFFFLLPSLMNQNGPNKICEI